MAPSKKLARNPPFRAEHLGSLLRPQQLLAARGEFGDKQAGPKELEGIEDQAINDIVKTQIDLGFKAFTDGEYRRHMFWGTFFPALGGMEEVQNPPAEIFRNYAPDIAAFIKDSNAVPGESVVCTGKIQHPGQSVNVGQFEYLKKIVPQERWGDIKLTLPAPEWYHYRYREGKAYPDSVYKSDDEYFADIVKAYHVELDILYKAGVRNVQFDDPNFTYFCDEKMLEGWAKDPLNTRSPDDTLGYYIDVYNRCIANVPEDFHIGIHFCRGNFVHSRHFSEGGYDRIAQAAFEKLDVNTFYLEYDTPRAGGFEPLKYLPGNKNVILGVVTSKFPEMEDKEEMKKRVYGAADVISKASGGDRWDALSRLGVSPQCGFASHAVGNLVSQEDMKKKLKLVREIADEIWPGEP